MAVRKFVSYQYDSHLLSSLRFISLRFWQVQYGNPDKLCVPLVEAKKNGGDLVVTLLLLPLFLKLGVYIDPQFALKTKKIVFADTLYWACKCRKHMLSIIVSFAWEFSA